LNFRLICEAAMSANLKTFLLDWLEWVAAGAVDGKPFERRHGLCYCFENWLDARDIVCDEQAEECCNLTDAFVEDGLSRVWPFGGAEAFLEDSHADAMHLNPARIQWVRSKISQFEVV
jgi:hypothetical protein